jgi:hypothetical protein
MKKPNVAVTKTVQHTNKPTAAKKVNAKATTGKNNSEGTTVKPQANKKTG